MNRVGVEDIPSVKIALIGDSGVGKTTLSTVLSTANFDTSPIYRPTVGCNIQVLRQIHDIQGQYFVELWDVGGNPRFVDARPLCYEHCDGYIFLWDSSMEVTYHSLQQWLGEITKARRAEEAQWASEYGMERTESNNASSSSSSVRCSPTNSHQHNHHNNNPQSPTTNIFGLRKQMAIPPPSPLLMSAESRQEFDGEFSVPLLIVGNKMDKLSRNDQKTLQMACAQQVFVSSRTAEEFDAKPFRKFFDEVYGQARNRTPGGTRIRSQSKPSPIIPIPMIPVTPNKTVPESPDPRGDLSDTSIIPLLPYTPDTSPQRERDRRDDNHTLFSISSLSFSSSLFSFSSPTATLRYRSVGTTVQSTDKDSNCHNSHLHVQEKV